MQAALWALAAAGAVTAGLASLAERRRHRRADLDRVGFMPWPTLQVTGIFVALVAAGLAVRG